MPDPGHCCHKLLQHAPTVLGGRSGDVMAICLEPTVSKLNLEAVEEGSKAGGVTDPSEGMQHGKA